MRDEDPQDEAVKSAVDENENRLRRRCELMEESLRELEEAFRCLRLEQARLRSELDDRGALVHREIQARIVQTSTKSRLEAAAAFNRLQRELEERNQEVQNLRLELEKSKAKVESRALPADSTSERCTCAQDEELKKAQDKLQQADRAIDPSKRKA